MQRFILANPPDSVRSYPGSSLVPLGSSVMEQRSKSKSVSFSSYAIEAKDVPFYG